MASNDLDEDDIKGILAALKEMRAKPNPKKKKTIKDVMREPEMWELITGCKDAGYSNAEIVDAINANSKGFKTTPGTFGSYYSEISREMTPNAPTRSRSKTPKATASKPTETAPEKSAEAPEKPEAKSGGKAAEARAAMAEKGETETKPQQPGMGSVLNSDDL
jgi:Mg-chelatase subunit ChlI